MAAASSKKTLEDFQRKHDPSFKTEYVGQTFHRPVDWSKKRRAIVVAAQNSTPVVADFWAILNNMASVLGAELIVIPLRYKNPTSVWTGSQQNAEWWAPEVRPYLWNVAEELNDRVMILGNIKTQPTNSNPLAGVDALSHSSSCVIAHTRAQSKSVPMMGNPAKWLMTSGAVTEPNYTDTRVGRLGHFHHSLSAVLIELSGRDRFHMVRLNYSGKTKRVIDRGIAYYADRVEAAPPSLALVMGDTHVDYVDPDVVNATFGRQGSLVQRTRPQHLVWHDLLDGHSCNPHHTGDPFADIAKHFGSRTSVSEETQRAIEFVRDMTALSQVLADQTVTSVIVPSNHIDFLRRWINKSDWKLLPAENRAFYLRTALYMAENTKLGPGGIECPDPFTEMFRAAQVPNTIALDSGESFRLAEVELAMHGDNGPNGAKGSRQNLKRVATKSIIGHAHSPGEDEGCTQVGTSTRLRLEYNGGSPSSWLNAHCDLNADGKRQLVIITEGEFAI